MWKILSAGFSVMYVFPKNSNGNSASEVKEEKFLKTEEETVIFL